MVFTIEKGIPIPRHINTGPPRKYFFGDMGIGDSFFIPVLLPKNKLSIQTSVLAASHNYNIYHPHIKITTRQMVGGVRVWRIE